MAGTFSGLPLSQQFDINGNPLGGALLYVYTAGTTTPASVFQDLSLTTAVAWPIEADSSGRIPPFFVADGFYHIRLTDSVGSVQFDYPQMPSIGPSSTGASGSAADTSTLFSTGDTKWRPTAEQLSGFVRLNGRTIGSSTSGASEFANAAAQALFIYLWNTFPDSLCTVIGGRGANALADWNANKQITLLDFRGCAIVGLDDMGSTDSLRLTGAPVAFGGRTTAASRIGETTHLLSLTEVPIHTHVPTLTLPSATLTLPSAALTLPSATLTNGSVVNTNGAPVFTGNAVTPSWSATNNYGGFSINSTSAFATGANQLVQAGSSQVASSVTSSLVAVPLPFYTPTGACGSITPSGTCTLPTYIVSGGSVSLSGGSVTLSGGSVALSGGSVANANAGGGLAHNVAQVSVTGTYYMKL